MDRRDFMKMATFAGLSVSLPAIPFNARANPYQGPLWVMVDANGGWDPTSLCDPKGRLSESEEDPMNKSYLASEIGQAGNIRFAPVGGNQAFFEKHYKKLLILNGVDTETNSHDTGSRNTWSGKLNEGHPCFAALVAGAVGRDKPMAFLTNGGFDFTAGLVAPTRTGNMGALSRLAFPNRIDTSNNDSLYHTEATMERIGRAQRERLESLMRTESMPARAARMSMLHNARLGENELKHLTEFLPAELDNTNNPLKRQAQVAIAGYRAGITVAASLSYGGFDTHGSHDAAHIPRLTSLLEGIDFLLEEAERTGIADRIVVVVGSDFGRTPGYNPTNGKDHWSVTSMMLLGPGIPGNRVIGLTDERHRAISLNPTSLAADPGGTRIKPSHVHQALRRLAGIDQAEVTQRFPIYDGALPLFG